MKEFDRLAARLLVVAPTGRALLLRIEPDFRAPFWVTPGGGLDEGETLEAAALRELAEEVGRADLPLGPCVWLETVTFTWGEWLVRQEQSTFLVTHPRSSSRSSRTRTPNPSPEGPGSIGWSSMRSVNRSTPKRSAASSHTFFATARRSFRYSSRRAGRRVPKPRRGARPISSR